METMPDERFTGDPWDALPERVQEHAEPWLKLLREYEQEYGALDEADGEGGLCSFLKHILWLVPLATVLRQRTELHGLYPMVHHAVIELKRLPHSIPQHEYFTYYAQAKGVFRLSFVVRQSNPRGWQCQELGRGDAEQVAHVLVDVVQNEEWPS